MPSPTTRHLIKNVWLFNDLEDDNKKCRESQSKTVQLDDSAHASPSFNSRVSNPHAKIPKKKERKKKTLPSGWEKKDRVIDALRRRLKQENTHPPPFYPIL